MNHPNSNPSHVDISLSRGVEISWADGHTSRFPLDYLRRNCPCATCRVAAEAPPEAPNPFPMFKPALRLTNAETVGRYALRLFWSDGHSSGLYSFDYLRETCPCPQCRNPVTSEQ